MGLRKNECWRQNRFGTFRGCAFYLLFCVSLCLFVCNWPLAHAHNVRIQLLCWHNAQILLCCNYSRFMLSIIDASLTRSFFGPGKVHVRGG